ncbi:hypothetical protein Clacol_001545 [Clathrus columnatus]|uniref:RNA helicase n=1 Tax=Clathrus columnatus TaxID=1419009 RepID=A0AAV5A3L7_9AGAM|nr:hypothetical protein Clacol_001545 [Clathrus columnatus]
MAAQSTALNPTSLPFYPGAGLRSEEDQIQNKIKSDALFSSSFSTPSLSQQRESTFTTRPSVNHQSIKSSPAPPDPVHITATESPRPQSVSKEDSLNSNEFPLDTNSLRSSANSMSAGTASDFGSISDYEVISGGDNRPTRSNKESANMQSPFIDGESNTTSAIIPGSQPISILRTIHRTQQQQDPLGYMPPSNAFIPHRATPPNILLASSPASSAGDSSARASTGIEYIQSIDAQLKASPLINEILDRLSKYELSNREIQRELGDVRRKLDILIARSVDATIKGPERVERASISVEPVFRNPFAPAGQNIPIQTGNVPIIPSNGNTPSSTSPTRPQEEIAQISQRLNTLTAAVSQILALQTQQHIQSISTNLPSQSTPNNPGPLNALDQAAPPASVPVTSTPPLPLPNRPDLRPSGRSPNLPMRTWSAGSLELPPRAQDANNNIGLGRPADSYLRDKRRSTVNLMRRDSTITENPGETWNANSRDGGPVVSKWEHLALAPELLRSIAKFGQFLDIMIGPPNKIQQRALPFLLRGADIIAQAPPTQERIAAYVIPAIHITLSYLATHPVVRGPVVVMISTTVDQATQAQRMIRDFGGPIGVRSALGIGATRNEDIIQELQVLRQSIPHILCGTPQKLHALFTASNGLVGGEVRFLVLDEVDQLIARNLHEYVFNIVKILPPPRSRPLAPPTTGLNNNLNSLPSTQLSFGPFDQSNNGQLGRRFSAVLPVSSEGTSNGSNVQTQPIERQTALFSNTVPQDVLNLANAIQLREPVRVLVRRDGNVTHADSSSGTRGLRQFYLYLAFTAGGRSDATPAAAGGGLGIIGSGRTASTSNAETTLAREWKLDALADLFDDIEVSQAIVHVGGLTSLDSVVYKLASRGLEAVPLHGDMNAGTKLAALNKFRGSNSVMIKQQQPVKVLVVYDVQVKAPDVFQVPLVINYDLPKAVEEYAHRVAPAISNNFSRAGVVVNFVTATGGDVEMLRSIECFYNLKFQ